MQVIETYTIEIALAVLMIVLCFLMDLYLAIGIIFPELNIRIEQKTRKALNKPPIIILDPWHIIKRNIKWLFWIIILSHAALFALVFII